MGTGKCDLVLMNDCDGWMATGTTVFVISLMCDLGRLGVRLREMTWVIVCGGRWVDSDSGSGGVLSDCTGWCDCFCPACSKAGQAAGWATSGGFVVLSRTLGSAEIPSFHAVRWNPNRLLHRA